MTAFRLPYLYIKENPLDLFVFTQCTHSYTPIWKNENPCGCERATGRVQSIYPLNNFNSYHCIIIKLCENVCWQNIPAKFDNQPDPIKHFGVMALELTKFAKINLVCSVFFNGLSSNFLTLFVSIISWQSLLTSQIPRSTLELWPLNYPKLPKLTLSAL